MHETIGAKKLPESLRSSWGLRAMDYLKSFLSYRDQNSSGV